MHLFINALAASAGGGLTYLRNTLPHLSAHAQLTTTVLVARRYPEVAGDLPRVSFLEAGEFAGSAAHRFWREQILLPGLIRRHGGEILISAGNMALLQSPVPQILLSRNALYTSRRFYADVRARREWRLWFRTHIEGICAKWSMRRSDWVIAPSEAFADEIRSWLGEGSVPVQTIPHGFDRNLFFGGDRDLPQDIQNRLAQSAPCLRLLLVSHYNYFRNFDTLIRALPVIKKHLGENSVKLFLTCRLHTASGRYHGARTQELISALGVGQDITELGLIPYPLLPKVYGACDIYVTASYAESFAHPLVEAMACGLPIVASDLPVHREVCGDAARYFPYAAPETLAEQIGAVACCRDRAQDMTARGLARSRDFSWKKHVSRLVSLAAGLAEGCNRKSSPGNNKETEAVPSTGCTPTAS
jgi:glycosyltransferase involved in cell wall biosynthesis